MHSHVSDSVIDWLLDSDPSIRWQVMRDLTNEPAEAVSAERSRIATEGWGAELLALQMEDGSWAGTAFNQELNSTMHVLTLLRELGLDPASEQAQRAVISVRDKVHWEGWDIDGAWRGRGFVGAPFFAGEVEPCINGQVAASGAYFKQDVKRIIDRLLREQLSDGGWNCDAPESSNRSSFASTICVLEALLEYERVTGGDPAVYKARKVGEEYLLERRLFFRLSTGEMIKHDRRGGADWRCFAFPTWWHYDVLRALDYLRSAGVTPNERISEAIDVVMSKRGDDGRWALGTKHPGDAPLCFNEKEGELSRWITLRALRVLDWYSANN